MLRTLVAIAAIGFLLAALVVTALDPLHWPAHAPMLAAALAVAAGTLFERRYRHRADAAVPTGFRPTGERFVDPETGRPVTVWSDPASGERRYVDAEPPPPPER